MRLMKPVNLLATVPFKFNVLAALLGAILLSNAPDVTAAGFNIQPMRMEMSARSRNSSVEITNLSGRDIPIQIKAFTWSQKDGKSVLEPTRDIFLAPPITNVKANAKQIVRFRLKKGADLDKEKSYRIFVEQIPPGDPTLRSSMAFRLRFSLPLFVAPNRYSSPAFDVSTKRMKGGVNVALENTGNVHVKVDKIEAFKGKADRKNTDKSDYLASSGNSASGTGYALPGATQNWFIPLSDRELADKSLQIAISTDFYNATGRGSVQRDGVIWVTAGENTNSSGNN